MYVCQYVSWLPFLLKLDKYRDISCSERDIFQKHFWDISGMFAHYFKISTNFLMVCQSVSWLTSLLKPGKNRDISGSWWDIFLNFFGDIPEMFIHLYQMIKNFLYVCQSLSWLTYWNEANKGISPVLDEISFRNLRETFLGCCYTISK